MSIVRIGLGETKKFAEGYEAIFGKKSAGAREAGEAGEKTKSAQAKKKKEKKKKK